MYYKVTTHFLTTYNGFRWEVDKWYSIPSEDRGGLGLCSQSFFHCYASLPLAEFLASLSDLRLFEVSVRGEEATNGMEWGFTEMRLNREREYPQATLPDLVNVALRCAEAVREKEQVKDMSAIITEATIVKELYSLHADIAQVTRLCKSLIFTCTLYTIVLPVIYECLHSADRSSLIPC